MVMVTKQEISGKWDSIVQAVQNKYGQITEIDLKRVEGDLNRLASLIEEKTGQNRAQVESFLDECCGGSFMDQITQMAESASETVREGYDQAAEQARRGYDYSAQAVSRRPLESLVAAAGVGALVGLMVGMSIGARRERDLTWRERWRR
jgi:uncharacterized protein YjbJ (UPF0337 family)